MMYTKRQIADALSKFIQTDLIDSGIDSHSRFSLCMAKKALRENPDLLDHFFKSPIVASVVKEEGDMYDVDVLIKTIKGVFADDSYSIILPKIPMFAPKDCIIKIDSADVDKIVSYIQPVSVA